MRGYITVKNLKTEDQNTTKQKNLKAVRNDKLHVGKNNQDGGGFLI